MNLEITHRHIHSLSHDVEISKIAADEILKTLSDDKAPLLRHQKDTKYISKNLYGSMEMGEYNQKTENKSKTKGLI